MKTLVNDYEILNVDNLTTVKVGYKSIGYKSKSDIRAEFPFPSSK
jgi:hypothetical protein